MVGIAYLPGRAVPFYALPASCQRCWSGDGQGDVVGRAPGRTVTGFCSAPIGSVGPAGSWMPNCWSWACRKRITRV